MIVKRSGALGDVILLTSAVREYKKRYPDKKLFVNTLYPEVFDNSPYVDGTNIKTKYEHVIDLDGAYEKHMNVHPILLYSDIMFGCIDYEDMSTQLFETEQDMKTVKNWWDNNIDKNKKTIVCHLGNTWVKIHPHVYEEYLGYIISEYNVILVGRGTEYVPSINGYINLTGNVYSIQRLKCLLSLSDMFFGTDSGISHIASCTPVNQLVCFSFVNPLWRRPLNKDNYISVVCDCDTPACAEKNKIIENNEFRGVTCKHQQCSLNITSNILIDATEKFNI